jgi:hypothetical protein
MGSSRALVWRCCSPSKRTDLVPSMEESKRREMFTWAIVDLISGTLDPKEMQLVRQSRHDACHPLSLRGQMATGWYWQGL